MNEYNAILIARTEYEHRNKSLAPVSDFGANVRDAEPGWLSNQAGHLLSIAGTGLTALGKRLKHEQNAALENTLTPQERASVSS